MSPILFTIPLWLVIAGTVGLVGVLLFLGRKKGFKENVPVIITGTIMLIIEIFYLRGKEGLEVPAYGFFIMIAFISGTYLASWRARQWGLDPNHVIDAGLLAVIFGILGARILFTIQYFDVYFWGVGMVDGEEYNKFWNVFKIWQGGLVFYGGLIGAAAADMYLLWRRKVSIPLMADLCMPSVMLGLAITRIGCFFNGCCFGKVCSLPWAVTYPKGAHVTTRQLEEVRMFVESHADVFQPGVLESQLQNLDYIIEFLPNGIQNPQALNLLFSLKEKVLASGINPAEMGHHIHQLVTQPFAEFPLAVHPSQIYASLAGFTIFAILLLLTKHRKFDGQIGLLFVILYSINRFLLEMTRSDNNTNLGLTISQWISVGVVTAGIMLMTVLWKRGKLTKLPIKPEKAVPAANPE